MPVLYCTGKFGDYWQLGDKSQTSDVKRFKVPKKYIGNRTAPIEDVLKYFGLPITIGASETGEPITDALNRTIAASVSDTCIYTMQDLLNLGNEARINTPATLGGNWTWRMLDGAITRELEHKLTDWTETYFRIPSEAEIELPQ